jgi:hypothetical protein
MPIEIYVAVLTACTAIVILSAVVIAVAVGLKARADAMDRNVAQLRGELSELIRESRQLVGELRQAVARASDPMEDLAHMTRTARGWTDRADRLIDAVGTVAEPPLFFLSKNIKTVGGMVSGVLQTWLTPKH